MSFEKIDLNIKNIASLTSKNSEEGVSAKIISEYISAFDELFSDGLEEHSIQNQINVLVNKKTPVADAEACTLNYESVKRMASLKTLIDSLPDNFPSKERLITRLEDNCSSEWIEKLKLGTFTNAQKDFFAFRKSQETVDWNNTVEVRTWGTKEELGNGLKNVLRQKIKGEDVGHASLMMRIPVNPENRALIDKYCLHENGSLKIPYQIKQYGSQPVYEIYWSYWPGSLNELKEDIEKERSGFEFTTKSGVVNKLPPELKERYFFQKQRTHLFKKTRATDLAPVATAVIGPQQYDKQRAEYVDLKVKKYKSEEEIKSLKTLSENYLGEKKEFFVHSKSGQAGWVHKPIKPSSNFLTLLARFKNELPNKKIYAKILKQHRISRVDAATLLEDITNLVARKKEQVGEQREQLDVLTRNIYAPSIEIKNIKKEIKKIQKKLEDEKSFYDLVTQLELLKNEEEPTSPQYLEWYLDAIELEETKKKEILSSSVLSIEQIDFILDALKKYNEEQRPQKLELQLELNNKLKKEKDNLEEMYKNPKAKTLELINNRVEEKNKLIAKREEKLLELKTTLSELEANKNKSLAQCEDKITKLEQLLVTIEEDKNTVIADGNKAIVALQKILLQAGKFKPRGFTYDNNREKTAGERRSFGKKGDDIWEIKNKADVEKLIALIKEDQKKLKENLLPDSIDFVYSRDKTEDEIARYGDNVNLAQEDLWEIKSKADIDDLIVIIKADQAKLKTDSIVEPIEFIYNNDRDKTEAEVAAFGNLEYPESNETIWEIKNKQGAEDLVAIIEKDIQKLKSEVKTLSDTIPDIQLQSRVMPEQLQQKHIIRGTPTNNIVLRDFNIEKMLEEASKLAVTTSGFSLMKENCSTTSMKLLHAGASPETKHMFEWTENTADAPAVNAFLTNPQSVHSVCALVSQAHSGDKQAQEQITKESLAIIDTPYYMMLNKLLTFRDDKRALLYEIKNNAFNYLKIVPSLIQDLWVGVDKRTINKNESALDTYLNTLLEAIKSQEYVVIKHQNPILAIKAMKDKLQATSNSLPFFDEKTLKAIKTFILDLEEKDPKSELETQQLIDYERMTTERDERVNCVERAVSQGKNVAVHLVSRRDNSAMLKWDLPLETQAELLVTKFVELYNNLRDQQFGPKFFRSNFITMLPKGATFTEKLKIIQQEVAANPTYLPATAWNKCAVQPKDLEGFSAPSESFKERLNKQSKEEVLPNKDSGSLKI